jgi:hypothetical protein
MDFLPGIIVLTLTNIPLRTVRPMKPLQYYSTNTVPYPELKAYQTIFMYRNGKVVWQGPEAEFSNSNPTVQEVISQGASVTEKVLDSEGYRSARASYLEEQQRLCTEFQADLFEEFGVSNHPKRFKAFDYAWQKGHSAGHSDVYSAFSEIVELIKD